MRDYEIDPGSWPPGSAGVNYLKPRGLCGEGVRVVASTREMFCVEGKCIL